MNGIKEVLIEPSLELVGQLFYDQARGSIEYTSPHEGVEESMLKKFVGSSVTLIKLVDERDYVYVYEMEINLKLEQESSQTDLVIMIVDTIFSSGNMIFMGICMLIGITILVIFCLWSDSKDKLKEK